MWQTNKHTSYNATKKIYFFVGSATESDSEDEENPDVKEAVRELVPDLATEDDEAHLNLSLDEESSIIAEYRTLLLSAGYDTNSSPLHTWKHQHVVIICLHGMDYNIKPEIQNTSGA